MAVLSIDLEYLLTLVLDCHTHISGITPKYQLYILCVCACVHPCVCVCEGIIVCFLPVSDKVLVHFISPIRSSFSECELLEKVESKKESESDISRIRIEDGILQSGCVCLLSPSPSLLFSYD